MIRRDFFAIEDVFQNVSSVDEPVSDDFFNRIEQIEAQLQLNFVKHHEQERRILAETLSQAKTLVIS